MNKYITDAEMDKARTETTTEMLNRRFEPSEAPVVQEKRGPGRPPKAKVAEEMPVAKTDIKVTKLDLFREGLLSAMRNRNVVTAKDVEACVPVATAYVEAVLSRFTVGK